MPNLIKSLLTISLIIGSSLFVFAQKYADDITYKVVINHEEQYGILPTGETAMLGWKETGKTGSFLSLEEYLNVIWTDFRPLSIRKQGLAFDTIYQVVINHEEQYSVWPANQKAPKGWKPTGKSGSLQKCNSYIKEVWTDMRPLSVRKKLKGKK